MIEVAAVKSPESAHRTRTRVVAAIAAVVCVGALGLSTWQVITLRSQVSALEEELTANSRKLRSVERELDEAGSDASSVEADVLSLAGAVAGLQRQMAQITDTGFLGSKTFDDVDDRIDALISCVNAYMDAAASPGYYRYFYC